MEEAARRSVEDTKKQIENMKIVLNEQEVELLRRTINRQKCQAEAFEKAYGHSVQKVTDDYVKLVTACCYQGGDGYAVHVPGTNPTKNQHWVLRPEKRAICEPTPLVREAFAILGINVSIANEPHIEKWGN